MHARTKCHLLVNLGIASLLLGILHSTNIWKVSCMPGTLLDHGDTVVAKTASVFVELAM